MLTGFGELKIGFQVFRFVTQNVTRVTARAHLGYLEGSDEQQCFIKVTNKSPRRSITITHVWFATTPEVDIINADRPLTKTLAPNDQWETWVPVAALPQTPKVEYLGRVVLAHRDRPVRSRLNRHVRPYGQIAGA